MWPPELPSAHPPLSPDLDNLRSAWAIWTKLGSGLFSGSTVPLLTVPLASYVPCVVPRFPVRVPMTSGCTTAAATCCGSAVEAQLAAGEEGHRGMAGTHRPWQQQCAALLQLQRALPGVPTHGNFPVCLLQPILLTCALRSIFQFFKKLPFSFFTFLKVTQKQAVSAGAPCLRGRRRSSPVPPQAKSNFEKTDILSTTCE